MKRGVIVFICLFLMISLSFVSASFFGDLFNKNKVTGEVIGQTTFSCDSLFSEFQYYFYICAQNGYKSVCFNKFSKVYQGCGDASGLYCTSSNTNAANNIACSTEHGLDGCVDSDGGLNPNIYGTIKGPDEYGTGNPGADYCWTDGRGVMEGYCNSKGYVNFYSYGCPNGCVNGACIKENNRECDLIGTDCPEGERCADGQCVPITIDCTDSDGGINYYLKGQIVGPIGPGEGSNGWDYCYNGEGTSTTSTGKYLLEWSCTSSGAANQKIYQCPNGCKNGACAQGSVKYCSVDATKCNLEWKIPVCGKVVLSGIGQELCEVPGNHSDSVSADFNFDNANSCAITSLCPNDCVNGACVHYECEIDPDCGANYVCINGNCELPCECASTYDCPIDMGAVCKDCRCVLQTEVNQSAKPDFTIKGFEFWNGDNSLHAGYYDRPISFKIVNKGATVMSAILYANLSVWNLNGKYIASCEQSLWANYFTNSEGIIRNTCPLNLSAGYYIFRLKVDNRNDFDESNEANNEFSQRVQIMNSNFACTDTDERLDYYTKGTAHGYNSSNFSEQVAPDVCLNPSRLRETYCEMTDGVLNGNLGVQEYICPCVNGACVNGSQVTRNCTDTDGVLNIYVKGDSTDKPQLFGPDSSFFSATSNSTAILHLPDKNLSVIEGEVYNYRGMNFRVKTIEPKGYSNGADRLDLESLYFTDACLDQETLLEYGCQLDGVYLGALGEDPEGYILFFNKSTLLQYKLATICPNGCVNGACVPYECEIDADCLQGKTCVEGICTIQNCVRDADCFADQTCVNHVCVAEGTECLVDHDCSYGGKCVNGACQLNTCEEEAGEICGADEVCSEGVNVKVSNTPYGETCCVEGDCIKEVRGTVCESGCMLNEKCYPFGYRKAKQYCSDNSEFVNQIKSDGSCDNNFECKSNVCVSSQCVSEGLMKKILNWFKNLFG